MRLPPVAGTYAVTAVCGVLDAAWEASAAVPIKAASAINPVRRPNSPSCTIRPPSTAPTTKHPRAATYGGTAPAVRANADTPCVPQGEGQKS